MQSIRVVMLTILVLMTFSLQTAVHAADTAAYKLAYVSYDDNDIWTINPDGSDAQQITHDGATKQGIIASPDGKYLAYYAQSWYDNEKTNYLTYQVVIVLDIATGEQHMITGQEAIDGLTWSPDSQQLVFAILTHHENFSTSYEIYRINRDGSERVKLSDVTSAGAGLRWSPDGKRILASRQNNDTRYQIFMMNTDGSDAHELIHFESCFICDRPRWTPDGQAIVFYRHPDLYIMDADGQHVRQLTNFQQIYNVIDVAYARYGQPSYSISADSQTLYYTMGYPLQIVKLDLGGNGWAQRTVLYDDKRHNIAGNQLSPDGKLLFFNADSPQGDLLSSLDLATGEVHVLAKHASQLVIVAGD